MKTMDGKEVGNLSVNAAVAGARMLLDIVVAEAGGERTETCEMLEAAIHGAVRKLGIADRPTVDLPFFAGQDCWGQVPSFGHAVEQRL